SPSCLTFASSDCPIGGGYAGMKSRQRRRFTGAIGTDQADALAFRYRKGNVGKKRGASVFFRKSLGADDRRQIVQFSPRLRLRLQAIQYSRFRCFVNEVACIPGLTHTPTST